MARPTGVGHALATFRIPIEGREEWLHRCWRGQGSPRPPSNPGRFISLGSVVRRSTRPPAGPRPIAWTFAKPGPRCLLPYAPFAAVRGHRGDSLPKVMNWGTSCRQWRHHGRPTFGLAAALGPCSGSGFLPAATGKKRLSSEPNSPRPGPRCCGCKRLTARACWLWPSSG